MQLLRMQTVQSYRKLAACFKWDSWSREHKSWKNCTKCLNANNRLAVKVKITAESEKTGWGRWANARRPHHRGVENAKKEEMAPSSKRIRRLAGSKGLREVENTAPISPPQSAQAIKWSQNPALSHCRRNRLREAPSKTGGNELQAINCRAGGKSGVPHRGKGQGRRRGRGHVIAASEH